MTTTTRPKLEGLVQEPSCDIKTRTGKFTRPSMIKYKGKVQSWIERQSEFLEEEKDGASKRLNGNLECGRNNNLGFGRRRQCVRVKGTRSEKGRKGQRVLMMVRGIAEGLAKRGKDKEVLEERRECLMRETERMAGVSTCCSHKRDVSGVVDTSVEDSAAPTTMEEITLAQTLIQIKAAKPKVVTTAATTITTTRPKARGVVVQDPSEFRTPQESQPSMIKDKGKAIMIELEVPLKRKYQVALDEDLQEIFKLSWRLNL
ncbi:hypothetical protein Tco_1439408 [Tanacetum coccineum]